MLGTTIHLNGLAVTVIGITPRDFVGTTMNAPAFWVPLSIKPLINADDQWLQERENQRYRIFGRLAPGINIDQAQAEMSPIADHLHTLHDPESDWAKRATVLVWPGSPFPLPLKNYGLDLLVLLTNRPERAYTTRFALVGKGFSRLAPSARRSSPGRLGHATRRSISRSWRRDRLLPLSGRRRRFAVC